MPIVHDSCGLLFNSFGMFRLINELIINFCLLFIVSPSSFLGFSFSGISFSKPSPSSPTKEPMIIPNINLFSIIGVVVNLAIPCYLISPIIVGELSIKSIWAKFSADNMTIKHDIEKLPKETFDLYESDYMQQIFNLKPILRFIIISVRYFLTFDIVQLYSWNFFTGGKIIKHLIMVNRIVSIKSKNINSIREPVSIILGFFLAELTAVLIGIPIFNSNDLKTFLHLITGNRDQCNDYEIYSLRRLVILISVNIFFFKCHIASAILFCHCMRVYSLMINEIILDKTKNIEEDKLKLIQLADQFNQICKMFELPMTSNFLTSIQTLIGLFCFLLRVDSSHITIMVMVCLLISFMLTRMVVTYSYGCLPTIAIDRLIEVRLESTTKWQLDTWLTLGEIQRLRSRFEVKMLGGVYFIRQRTIMYSLGFIINYIVVLLQTENY